MMKKIALSLFIAFISLNQLYAQEINTAKLDSFFNALAANNKGMGSFAIAKNGKIVYQRSLGYSQLGQHKITAAADTRYRIGSITKMFTATLIFQLIEAGKLSLDTKLARYFPQIPNAENITVGHLLNHTSGLTDYVNDAKDMSWITVPHTKTELLDTIARGKVHFAPGTSERYCNSGYLLLGYIIEKITGKPYSKVINDRIFAKIGLQHTVSSKANSPDGSEALPYAFLNSWNEVKDIYFPNVTGVGDILSTPEDLLTFINALSAGKLISAQSFDQMKAFKEQSGTGMGLFRMPFYSKKGIGHSGGTFGTYSVVMKFEADELSFASCINGLNYPANDISIAVLSICYHQPFDIPSFKSVTLKTEDLDAHLGIYASKQIPLKITFTKQGTSLVSQATGQSAFPLEAVTRDKFKFDSAGIVVEFNREKQEMTLRQRGAVYVFVKEKAD